MMIQRATEDEGVRFEAVAQLLKLLGRKFGPRAVPSHLGTERDRIIRRVTGCPDPYAELKRRADEGALEAFPGVEALVEAEPEENRFRVACMVACLGNVIEYDVPGHCSDVEGALGLVGEGFFLDDTDEFKELVGPCAEVLYLADNAGEIAFDRLVVRELRRMGCRVTVAVKGGPSLNDALMGDAEAVGMTGEADGVVSTGTDAVGIRLKESSDEFMGLFRGADAIVSKGMANWETLTEVPAPCPVLYVFRTKCWPVASSVGAPVGVSVARLVPKGWRL